MATASLTRPRTVHPASPSRTTDPGSKRLRDALLVLTTAGVLAGGTWGLLAPRAADGGGHGDGHAASAVASVALPDGVMRVDGLVDKQVGHVMPGMSVAEDVPVGMRRFSVDVTLAATEDRRLAYSRRDFTVSGPGVKPVVPVDGQFDSGALTPGQALSGSLSFDVPKDSATLSLQFRATSPVALPALPAMASSTPAGKDPSKGHGGTGHDAGAAGGAAGGAAPTAPDHPHTGTVAPDHH